jgi:hypothetical protein
MNRPLLATLATALALASTAANADGSATGALTGLRVQLFNLAASRTSTPAVTFQDGSGSSAQVEASSPATNASGADSQSSGVVFGAVDAGSSLGHQAGGAADITGNAWTGNEGVSATAFAETAASQSEATAYLGDGDNYTPFTLSADTLMVISMTASLSASTGTAPDDYAIASAEIEFLGTLGDNSQQSLANALAAAGGAFGTSHSLTETLTVTFANPNDFAIDGTFFGGLDATAVAGTSQVPEPAGGTMLWSALALFAACRMAAARRMRAISR